MNRERSLNGGRTHPLSPSARKVLSSLAESPVPRSQVNPGIVDRLTREPLPLAEVVDFPSPFKAHRGGTCPHLQITETGRTVLRETTP